MPFELAPITVPILLWKTLNSTQHIADLKAQIATLNTGKSPSLCDLKEIIAAAYWVGLTWAVDVKLTYSSCQKKDWMQNPESRGAGPRILREKDTRGVLIHCDERA